MRNKSCLKRFVRTLLIALCAVGFLSPAALAAHGVAIACHNKAKVIVALKGMTCLSCDYGLRKELLELPGVEDVQVDFGDARATMDVKQSSEVTNAEIAQAVKQAGLTPGRIQCR